MINWESIAYDLNRARIDFEKLEVKSRSIEPINPNSEFLTLRNLLIQARNKVFEKYNFDLVNRLDYQFDLTFGLELYQILNNQANFTNRAATNDDVWRYMSICIIPDIVHSRWSLNADHFYKTPRRIWLKTIWWYVHLSWRGSVDETYGILKNNSTDTIVQLVERPGIGYHRDVYRELMLQYSTYGDTSRELFRRVLKLNTARLLTTSPEFVKGGIKSYIADLFKDAMDKD